MIEMSFKEWLCNLIGCEKNASLLELASCKSKLEDANIKVNELEKVVPKEDAMEKYWNEKYPKQFIKYRRKEIDGEYEIDVRNYFQPYDKDVLHTVASIGTLPESNDDKALACLLWVIDNIKYVSDESADTYKSDEYWAWTWQTLKHKAGDCEDGAILLSNLMLQSGIPYWRIRLNAGSVNGGGHAYCTYLCELDNGWRVMDWCYWANRLPIKDRKLHKDEQNYSDVARNYSIWFSWNLKHSFGQMQTMSGMPNDFVTH